MDPTALWRAVLAALLLLDISAPDAHASAVELRASDGKTVDAFGTAVALSADTALVGAPSFPGKGAVYIFRSDGSTWTEDAKLTPSDDPNSSAFGSSVAIAGGIVLVGAPTDAELGFNAGAAYVFRHDGTAWVEEAKLLASDGLERDAFGRSVAIAGDVGVVGASGADDNGSESGKAYVFRFDGAAWVEEEKLVAPGGASFDRFGASVAVSDGGILIGAPGDDQSGLAHGAAYVYRFTGTAWVEEAKLVPDDSFFFGSRVSLSGDTALIGALETSSGKGAAHVYRFDGVEWLHESTLIASGLAGSDQFGASGVALRGDVAVIGARFGGAHSRIDSGAAYAYRFDGATWGQETMLFASGVEAEDEFGYAVAVSGERALIGARFADDNGWHAGAAWIFEDVFRDLGVPIDIEPDLDLNTVDPAGDDTVPVAILGLATFAVSELELATLTFGPHAARADTEAPVFGDVNGDGREDVIVGFPIQDSGIAFGASEACVSGETLDGRRVDGCGPIVTVQRTSGGFESATLTAEWLYPSFDSVLESHTIVVGPGVELPDEDVVRGSHDIDVGPGYIRFEFPSSNAWTRRTANGWRFTDTHGTVDEIVGFHVNSFSPGVTGLDPGDLSFTADSVFANFGGGVGGRVRSTRPGDFILLEVEFAPEPRRIDVDIRPDSELNAVNPSSRGVIPVAILGSDALDVADLDATTLAFGPAGAAPAHRAGGHLEDVNDDGVMDLVSHYPTGETGVAPGETEACVTGETFAGLPLEGCDSIRTTPGCGIGFELAFLLPALGRRVRSSGRAARRGQPRG